MKVFISWSGEKSKEVAQIVKWWLSVVHPATEPWLSTADIQAGDRWASEIESGLADAAFGIICVTPQNFDSRWINFEAGAISKQVGSTRSRVATLLIDFSSPTELEMPLSQFNAVMPTEEGFLNLALSINSALGEHDQRDRETIKDLTELVWSRVTSRLEDIQVAEPNQAPRTRADSELLDEILLRVRKMDSVIENISSAYRDLSVRTLDLELISAGSSAQLVKTDAQRSIVRAWLEQNGSVFEPISISDEKMAVIRNEIRKAAPRGMNPRRIMVEMNGPDTLLVATPRELSADEKHEIKTMAWKLNVPLRELEFRVSGLDHITDENFG